MATEEGGGIFFITDPTHDYQKAAIALSKTHFLIKLKYSRNPPIALNRHSLHSFFRKSGLTEADYLQYSFNNKPSLYKTKELRFSLPNLKPDAIKQFGLFKDIEESIYPFSPHQGTFINQHFQSLLILWEVLYALYILLAVNMIIHLYFLVLFIQSWSFYFLYIGLLIVLMLKTGISSMICFIKDQSHLICNGAVFFEVLISLVLTMGVWPVISLLDEKAEQYISKATRYNVLFIGVFIVDFILLVVNYFMDEYYRDKGVSVSYHELKEDDQ